MKRIGNIFDRVLDWDNLRLAFWKAGRGKRGNPDVLAYQRRLDDELARLRDGLADGSYPVGGYHRFTVYEPKERLICEASFRDRVLHHALMNVCEPFFERWLVSDTFACRVGKGQKAALARGAELAARYRRGWYLKCDVRKYFDNVPHGRVMEMLRRKFKDPMIVFWFGKILDTYETAPGRGLPIGNLTSQHLANLYLDPLDRLREARGLRVGYVRYMDDFVFWSGDRDVLRGIARALPEFLASRLGLELKRAPEMNRMAQGIAFLGMRLTSTGIRASRETLRRYRAKVRAAERNFTKGIWSEGELAASVESMTAFLRLADTVAWGRSRFGTAAEESRARIA